jgi:hypothetical protein
MIHKAKTTEHHHLRSLTRTANSFYSAILHQRVEQPQQLVMRHQFEAMKLNQCTRNSCCGAVQAWLCTTEAGRCKHGPCTNDCSTHLAFALVGSSVSGHEANFIVGLDLALLHTAGEHITHTLSVFISTIHRFLPTLSQHKCLKQPYRTHCIERTMDNNLSNEHKATRFSMHAIDIHESRQWVRAERGKARTLLR